MTSQVIFDSDLIKRYDKPGPRYRFYPPPTQFSEQISATDYRIWSRDSNEEPIPRPLSLYFHIPFYNTECDRSGCNSIITADRQKAAEYLKDLFIEIELQSGLFDPDRVVQQLHWGGGTTTFLDNEQIVDLRGKIDHHFRLLNDDSGEYSIEVDPQSTGLDTIKLLRDIGFNRLNLGVQNVDIQVGKTVYPDLSLDLTASIVAAARRTDYRSVNIDLIYGQPHHSLDSFSDTLESLIELEPDRVALYNYADLPYRFPPHQHTNTEDFPDADEKLAIFQYSIERLTKAGYVYIGLDHFAKPLDELAVAQRKGSLHRNIQGYSTSSECDSVAMGVSAISNIGSHFCQNTLDIDTYHESLAQCHLPIYRGFYSNQEDAMRREIIQQLVCNFHLDIGSIENHWNIEFKTFFAHELNILEAMSNDRLLYLSDKYIDVGKAGRLLIRNICMVFDRYTESTGSE